MCRSFPSILVLLTLAFFTAGPAAAQTPAATVEDGSDTVVLQSFVDGSLLVPGTIDTGTIPASGAGTRMMWYPAKAAFRAGRVGDELPPADEWDDANVGPYSAAFGHSTTASDQGSTAMGLGTTASGLASTATGWGTIASGHVSTAMGNFTVASGAQATALGLETTAATSGSLSIGECNDTNTSPDNSLLVAGNGQGTATGSCNSTSDALVLKKDGHLTAASTIESESGGFVLPDGTVLDESGDIGSGLPINSNGAFDISNDDGIVASGTFEGSGSIPATGGGTRMMWYPAKAAFRAGRVGLNSSGDRWNDANVGNYSAAFGLNTTASGSYSTAIGTYTNAAGTASTTMGVETTASSFGSTAMGGNTTASGEWSTAMGRFTTANGPHSTTMGYNTNATGSQSTAMGDNATAASNNSLSIGQWNSANQTDDGTLFAAGNGSSGSRSDALVLDQNGNLNIAGRLGPTIPGDQLHLVDESNAGGHIVGHAALVENTATGTEADGLAVRLGTTASPGVTNNFLSFYDGDNTLVGQIEGNGSGGVQYLSSGGDFAELLPRLHRSEAIEAGDVVGVFGGTITKETAGAEQVMVVTDRAVVLGNAAVPEGERGRYEAVSFVGQVPVRVRGTVAEGDLLVASGHGDGTARAVKPSAYDPASDGAVIGRAWEASVGGERRVNAVIGRGQPAALRNVVRQQEDQIEKQQATIDSLRKRVRQIESLEKRVARLEAQSTSGTAQMASDAPAPDGSTRRE